ncbi:18950_t:CDS:2 [Funneliformis geosporum]|uniref:9747_t:CDS:1 n=1 Tax=Funneliformis geosporum TaxID=1117311 RepID=A0A9W4SD79_9GLOM|nr:18950_t:CDS:2 [Funneliformis geosporum]CAI2165078.1 9747_t:CDS:2 [Funneliformis geosporum]
MPFILSQYSLVAAVIRLKHEVTGGLMYKREAPKRTPRHRAAFDDVETVYSTNSTSVSMISSQSFRTSINSIISNGRMDAVLSPPTRPSTAYLRIWMLNDDQQRHDDHQICSITRNHPQDIFIEPPPPYKS